MGHHKTRNYIKGWSIRRLRATALGLFGEGAESTIHLWWHRKYLCVIPFQLQFVFYQFYLINQGHMHMRIFIIPSNGFLRKNVQSFKMPRVSRKYCDFLVRFWKDTQHLQPSQHKITFSFASAIFTHEYITYTHSRGIFNGLNVALVCEIACPVICHQ